MDINYYKRSNLKQDLGLKQLKYNAGKYDEYNDLIYFPVL